MIVPSSRIFSSRLSYCQRRSCHAVRRTQFSCRGVPTPCCTRSVSDSVDLLLSYVDIYMSLSFSSVDVCQLAYSLLVCRRGTGYNYYYDFYCYICMACAFVSSREFVGQRPVAVTVEFVVI